MGHVFHRHCHTPLPTAVKGDGAYLIDQSGKTYFDASGGAAVSCLGHSHPAVREAMHQQLDQLAYAHSTFFTTEATEQLADFLAERAPGELNHIYFVSSGSEAMEAALKLARQYFLEIGQPQRKHFIARRQSYHGNTLGALSVGGNMWRREPFDPILMDSHHISACYPYREQRDNESAYDYGQRIANELESKILALGADSVIAFVAEPVVGATAGALVPVEGYFRRVREICDQYGVLLILDEVMCGMGRTGTLFAHEQEQINADIVTIAKGLGAGYQPIGAMVTTSTIYQAIANGSGFFQHGHTYMGHTLASRAALAVMQTLEQGLLGQVSIIGEQLMSRLHDRFDQHQHMGDIRGRGLFIGLELVHDRSKKTPFQASSQLQNRIRKVAMDKGVLCYPMSGTIDGKSGHHILLAPPFIIQEHEQEMLVDTLSQTLDQVFGDLIREGL